MAHSTSTAPVVHRAPAHVLLQAPSSLGLRTRGVEELPSALLRLGLEQRLGVRSIGRVEPRDQHSRERDRETNVLNAAALASYTPQLANAIEPLVRSGQFPIVLGGDCTIVLGAGLALRRLGRYGLLFIDGQADFFQPDADPYGEAASMDLAFATGHGPRALTEFEGYAPLFRQTDVVAFGFRDAEDQAKYGSQPLPDDLRSFDLDTINCMGASAAADAAIEHLTRDELQGFWIHVDVDCLDDAVMPAVDFRLPGGLSPDQLQVVLERGLRSGRAVGLEITIYNPELDTDGNAGQLLVDLLVRVLSRSKVRS